MNPLYERLNDRLERQAPVLGRGRLIVPTDSALRSPLGGASNDDPEVDTLVALARRLQAAPPLQVDPNFARRLEGRILAHNAALRPKQPARTWWGRLFLEGDRKGSPLPRNGRVHPIFGTALVLCMLLLLLGTGVLVVAAQVSNPNNPLYGVKHWEQHVQVSLASSSADQAELYLQFARDRLNTLANLADPAHAQAYRQALVDLDQQITTATEAINTLPAGAERDRLASELATLKANARHTLRASLLQLALPERLLTTAELNRLGDTVTHLYSVEITLTLSGGQVIAHPNGQATIRITGDNLQPAAQLLVNGRLQSVSGSLQNNVYVFVLNWTGNQHPHSIGILNPDGTATQTTTITLKISGSPGHGNGNGNGGGNGNGNVGGKPGSTPTPHH